MKAMNFEPFLINTPAHIPHTLPKVNSYRFREDAGGGGRSESFAAGGGVTTGGGACCDAGSGNTSAHKLDDSKCFSYCRNRRCSSHMRVGRFQLLQDQRREGVLVF